MGKFQGTQSLMGFESIYFYTFFSQGKSFKFMRYSGISESFAVVHNGFVWFDGL